MLTVDLPDRLADNQFYWVQISSSLWTYGSEAVQGLLCDDPCSGGSTADGRRAEGVVAGLGIGAEQGLFTIASERKRGWLASRLFARERSQSPPSLDPGDPTAWPTADNPTLQGQDWQPPPAPESVSNYVRLAVVISDPELGWQIDVWTARRDHGAPTPYGPGRRGSRCVRGTCSWPRSCSSRRCSAIRCCRRRHWRAGRTSRRSSAGCSRSRSCRARGRRSVPRRSSSSCCRRSSDRARWGTGWTRWPVGARCPTSESTSCPRRVPAAHGAQADRRRGHRTAGRKDVRRRAAVHRLARRRRRLP